MVKAQGWFQVLASHRLHISAHVTASKYTHHARAWGFAVPVYEWPFPVFIGELENVFTETDSRKLSEIAKQIIDTLRRADAGADPAPSGAPRADARGLVPYEPELEFEDERSGKKGPAPPQRKR